MGPVRGSCTASAFPMKGLTLKLCAGEGDPARLPCPLDTKSTDGKSFEAKIFQNNSIFDSVKRNVQSELNQRLVVVKVPPAF